MNRGELAQLQSMPLEYAVRKSIRTLREADVVFEGMLVRSKSGFDSQIVSKLCELAGLDYPAMSISRLEPKGNNALNAKDHDIEFLPVPVEKKAIIRRIGYPMLTKEQSMALSRYMLTEHEYVRQYRLHGKIDPVSGKKLTAGKIANKNHELIYAPFWFTEKCCEYMKKAPLMKYEKKTGRVPITGERAAESKDRRMQYLKHGCIVFDQKKQKVMPIGFWSDQHCKEFALKYNMEYAPEYGDIVEVDGKLQFTGESRTGCDICGFGIEADPERFHRMHEENPNRWAVMMNGGEFIVNSRDLWRPVKFWHMIKFVTPEQLLFNIKASDIPGTVLTNLVWVPNDKGYGYREVINYINEVRGLDIKIK